MGVPCHSHTVPTSAVCPLLYVGGSVGLDVSIIVCCLASFFLWRPRCFLPSRVVFAFDIVFSLLDVCLMLCTLRTLLEWLTRILASAVFKIERDVASYTERITQKDQIAITADSTCIGLRETSV